MKPVINIEEQIGKTVGRRLVPNPLRTSPGDIQESEARRRNFGGVRVPRGVFRFATHEEADAWLMKNITRPRN
ncbi:MAG TPA: hypothetical protein VGO90_16750 [Chthoniobacteraceae bacterium]|jgi:hypothetical protein|nr:hypothetical protein [Chthoniobacteraceae bacterium]